ncbi:Mandelate racemase/muconate lactonizing protein [Natrinema pellirubrum DSM 15624]|uniref:Enolase superfamily enzyme related to L-alanine-DL-glutamate epimerase n=1 Tax=Natrinema pellirubrum (strain DSM 15624 / CIP 106293 / JCM 10476 / NCIMB 786 / 157) TaxID=797303 RepID=L0JPY6_NATP1|nr:dipeptide epimerase [Natrinema pellirubrum]AGB32888.1 enolase superfamily enzyme related to L-alanine-DL-glutamate epimerase [Natrinema pellirubrum DSM 15624]ELY75648.1 Mandelate racemase/muconate lactonizing protein [Natrinema pellirubrum DSM 15624]
MSLETSFERRSLPLEYPFGISRGTTTEIEVVYVRIEDDDGTTGLGAAAPSTHYGETAATVAAVLPDLLAVVESVGDPHQLERIERRMRETVRKNPAARAAVSIALHDLVTKRLEVPLYRYWGLDPAETLSTSYTIGLDDTERMREKTETALERGFDTLKVKLGTDRDLEIVRTIRSVAPDVRLFVDANEAWTPREAVRKIDRLAEFDLAFVEQPVAAEDPEGLQFVSERSALPIAADESCRTLADIPRIADRCDIANLKLMKCGGLREARRLISAARAHGLEVMCGCMNESNASIAAACHLAPLLDYADLDGSLLLADDPVDGVPLADGRIDLAALERSGTGAGFGSS